MEQKFKRFVTRDNKGNVLSLAAQCADTLLQAHDSVVVEVRNKKRSDEQNAKLHAMLSDISKAADYAGQKRTIEQWKMIFVSAHSIATGGQAEMAVGLEGEVINLRESTANMGVKRLASLIEYIHAWCADNGIDINSHNGGERVNITTS